MNQSFESPASEHQRPPENWRNHGTSNKCSSRRRKGQNCRKTEAGGTLELEVSCPTVTPLGSTTLTHVRQELTQGC